MKYYTGQLIVAGTINNRYQGIKTKQPKRNKIKSSEMWEVFRFDRIEFFNPDDRFQNKYWYMNKFQTILNFTEKVLATKKQCRILDLGCAQGNYSLTLSKKHETIGIDIKSNFIKYALMKKEPSEDAIFLCASAEDLPFENDSFDLVLCSELVEHVANPKKMIEETKRILKPKGHLIVSTPNGNCLLFISSKSFKDILKVPIDERKRILHTYAGHIFLFREREIESLLENSNFKIVKKIGIYSLALGQSIPPARINSNRTPSRILWLPKLFKFIPLPTFRKIEMQINSLPIIGSLLARDLIYISNLSKETQIG